MGKDYYIFKNCKIRRRDDNLELITAEGAKKNLQVETAENLYVFGECDFNSKALVFMGQKNVAMHIFNYYGFYSGSFFPRDKNVSGFLLIKQVNAYQNPERRLSIAREFIHSAAENIYRNLRYYHSRGADVKATMTEIQRLTHKIKGAESIQGLMGCEGNIRKKYYSAWTEIIKEEVEFEKRVKNPPDNMVNCLISFINSLFYTTVLGEIYKTELNPTVSFLHEPSVKRFSLSLDLSEVFKPLVVDRMIFALLNKRIITSDDFEEGSNYLYLKEKGKRKILLDYEQRLDRKIKHKTLERNVSYKYLIRLECYKLIKHLNGEGPYEAFRMWW